MNRATAECVYCHGTGRNLATSPPRPAIVRGAANGPLPPFGREVEQAVDEDRVPPDGVDVFVRDSLMPVKDVLALANWTREKRGLGSAMILPTGAAVAAYRWPVIPVCWQDMPAIVVWAYGASADEERAYGEAFVRAGYDVVDVRGGCGLDGPQRFRYP